MPTCPKCGAEIDGDTAKCFYCGTKLPRREVVVTPSREPTPAAVVRTTQEVSECRRSTALLLCLFLGWTGAHRFYVGKSYSGRIWALTLGILGVGWLVDLATIAVGSFKDSAGLPLA